MKLYLFFTIAISSASFSCHLNQRRAETESAKKIAKNDRPDSLKVKRYASVTGIKEDKIEYYKNLHAAVWPGILKKIRECNIRNFSIYLSKIEGKYYLFSYYEYSGSDIDADMKKMAGDSITMRWWKETDPTQIPLPEAAAKNQIWTSLEEVFHTN